MEALHDKLSGHEGGAAAVEFAMAAPVLLLAMMGVFDLGYNMYTQALLQGAIQEAARNSTLEDAASNTAKLDAKVTSMVRQIAPQATLSFDRTSYADFSDVGQAEDFTDADSNGLCDNGEPFEDANGNGIWDADRGSAGLGGARDAVLYKVTVVYDRPFPVARLLGQDGKFTMQATTVLRNQPWDLNEAPVSVAYCS